MGRSKLVRRSAKNVHAVALGKLGGLARAVSLSNEERSEVASKAGTVGGRARASALTPERRTAIAKKAAAKSAEIRKRKAAEKNKKNAT